MNIETINLQKSASQQISANLAAQSCTIRVHQRNGDIYVDLHVISEAVVLGVLARDRVGLTRHAYLPFRGELLFVDAHSTDDPQYTGLGERWLLAYLYK